LSRRALLWLVPLFITLHNLEEMAFLPGILAEIPGKISAWAVKLFPVGVFPPSYRTFLVVLLAVMVLPYAFASLGGASRVRGLRTFLLTGSQAVMFVNVFSHLAMMNIWNGYVPGLVTALAFNLPFSLFFFASGLRQGWLRWNDFAYLLPFAILLHGPGLLGLMVLAARV
jgi:hypothetical protein